MFEYPQIDDMHTINFEELEGKYVAPIKYSLKTKVRGKIKKMIKSALRVIGGQRVNNADYGLLFVLQLRRMMNERSNSIT